MRKAAYLFALFLLMVIISSGSYAADRILSPHVNGVRFYSSNAGARTLLVVSSTNGPKERLQAWVFGNSSSSPADYIRLLTSGARPRQIDVYLNPDLDKYVVSWLAKKGTIYFGTIDPMTKAYKVNKVRIKTKKKIRSCHTTYCESDDVYIAALSDGDNITLLEIDASNFKIINTQSFHFEYSNKTVAKTDIGDMVYAPAYKRIMIIFDHYGDKEFSFAALKSVTSKKWKIRGTKYYYGDKVPDISLHAFKMSSNSDRVFFSFTEDYQASEWYTVYSNYMSKSGKPGRVYYDVYYASYRPLGVPAVDHVNNKAHFVVAEDEAYEPDYGLDDFEPILRLYSVNASGGRINGPMGVPIRLLKTLPTRTGAAVVNGQAVIFYTLNGQTYYGPWNATNW